MLKRDNVRPIIITFQRFLSPFRDSDNILLRAPTAASQTIWKNIFASKDETLYLVTSLQETHLDGEWALHQ